MLKADWTFPLVEIDCPFCGGGWNGLTSPEHCFEQPDDYENDCDSKCYMDQSAPTKDEHSQ